MPNKTKLETTNDCRIRLEYGIPVSEVGDMNRKQMGKCAICKRVFGGEKINKPHIDHDHASGWVRGLLCNTCNTGLGNFGDDVEKLQNAIEYLVHSTVPTEFNIYAARESNRKNGHTFSPEELALRKIRNLGNTYRQGLEPWNKGKQWDEATRHKMSEAAKRRWAKEPVDAQQQ
jgi:hypothetical protein